MLDAPYHQWLFITLAIAVFFAGTLIRARWKPFHTFFRKTRVEQQTVAGVVRNLALASDEPGTLQVNWDAADPVPTDYRVNWAASNDPLSSHGETSGNVYAKGSACRITDLVPGAAYQVRVRSRHLDENGKEQARGPWTPMEFLTVANEADRSLALITPFSANATLRVGIVSPASMGEEIGVPI